MPNPDDEQMSAALQAGVQAALKDAGQRKAEQATVPNPDDEQMSAALQAGVQAALKGAEQRKAEATVDSYKHGCGGFLALVLGLTLTIVFPPSLFITLPLLGIYAYKLGNKGS